MTSLNKGGDCNPKWSRAHFVSAFNSLALVAIPPNNSAAPMALPTESLSVLLCPTKMQFSTCSHFQLIRFAIGFIFSRIPLLFIRYFYAKLEREFPIKTELCLHSFN